jgi:hypothetical protein
MVCLVIGKDYGTVISALRVPPQLDSRTQAWPFRWPALLYLIPDIGVIENRPVEL